MATLDPTTSVRDIVAVDFRAAAVFERHGIDYCCGGGRTIAEASAAAAVPAERLLSELGNLAGASAGLPPRFAAWNPAFLVDYIIANHHAYVRAALPAILAHAEKVADKHGARHPEMIDVARTFADVAAEMAQHMMKEEQILFPYVQALAAQAASGCPVGPSPFGSIANPIRMMETEHESAGNAMRRIRDLTGNYAPPDDACTTYRVTLAELEAFERDLHQHVHLENNILFPRALEMEGD